jgi:amino acid adenylation domain-containing protein
MDNGQSTTANLVVALRTRGVKLWVEGDQLRCAAPKGALSAELKSEIAARKQEIISLLSAGGGTADHAPARIARIRRDGTLPVSFSQQRLWFLDQFEPGSAVYNIPAAVRLKGILDAAALERTVSEIIKRHESLRTNIVTVDGEPATAIQPFRGWSLDVKDLQHLPAAESELAAQRLASQLAQQPFALAHDPLLRTLLVKLAPQDHVLVIVFHHVVTDGWSLGVFVNELATLYGAFSAGRPSPLPELDIQYVDYAAWQREWLRDQILDKQLAYWKRKLAGELPVLALPFDRPRPPLQSFRGARAKTEVPADVVEQLRDVGRTENCTLFMVLLAGLNTLFFRYTGQEDIIIGSSSANRGRIEVEPLIGFFINNLVLRCDLSGNPSFRRLLTRVRETVFEAESNQDAPFEKIVEAVQAPRSLSYSPVFQVMFNFQSFPMNALKLPGVSLSAIEMPAETTRYDINLDVQEVQGRLQLSATYNTDLFDAETVGQMLRHYCTLLRQIASAPDSAIAELPLLDDTEREHLVHAWNETGVSVTGTDVVRLFEARVAESPTAPAVVFAGRELSYAELNARANRLAHALRRRGAGPDVLIGICMRRSVEMVVGLLGILKSGAAYVPLDPSYPQDRLAFMTEDAALRLLVTDDECSGALPPHTADVIVLGDSADFLSAESDLNPSPLLTPRNLAYVIFTSGSTGKPKGVQIEHAALVNFLQSMRKTPGLRAADRLLSVTTISFDIFGLELYLPLTTGAVVVLAEELDALDGRRLGALLRSSAATVMQATPATWRLLLEGGWADGSGLKALCGGEALPRELADRLLGVGVELWNVYGPTETTIWSTAARVTDASVLSIGRPIDNTQVYILDARLQPVPIGVAGELFIGGAGLARGYLNRPELTAERFAVNPFRAESRERIYRTGDVARHRRDGTIDCLGRVDHQVKVRGFRIELGEIESVLERHSAVRQAAVVVREDDPGDARLVAYWASHGAGSTVGELRRHVGAALPEYMVPSTFVQLAEFPLTPNGKIDRKKLPAPSSERPAVESAYVEPATDLERSISSIWQDVLKIEQVGVRDNFFDLGGSSLLIVQVQSKIESVLRRRVPLVEFFQRPTVAALADLLGGGTPEAGTLEKIRTRAQKQRAALGH